LPDCFLVDASVMAKWFNKGEANEKEALALRNAWTNGIVELFGPSLIIYEVCNSIWKNPNIQRDQALSLAKLVVRLGPSLIQVAQDDSEEAMKLARKTKLTFYDSIYIVLSKSRKCPLITSDNDQLEIAKDYTTSSHISNLSSLLRTYPK
jgi:predicted nucleic acid-binding protein